MNNKYSFFKYRSVGIRIWHWLNALVIFGLLGTVFLRKTFLSWKANSLFIQEKAAESGLSIPTELSTQIAKGMRDSMWNVHINLGIVLAILLLIRIFIRITKPKECPVKDMKSAIKNAKNSSAGEKGRSWYFAGIKSGHVIFYLMILFMAITGCLMTFSQNFGLQKTTIKSIEGAHEFMLPFIIAYVILHILGVIVAELKGEKGLISEMIHGGEKNK